jgi:hypothetical protein
VDWDRRKGGCNTCNAVTALSLNKKYFDFVSLTEKYKLHAYQENGVTALHGLHETAITPESRAKKFCVVKTGPPVPSGQ